jgi:flavin-dependent dehydrogenase
VTNDWDVIIVGARCAGAGLGTLLARKGVRVLMLDAAPRGTDLPMSTHYVQPPGMAAFDRLGLGDRIRSVTPPTRVFRAAIEDTELLTPLREGRFGYCVRRSTVDPWLQDTAEAAGVEFRDRHRVTGLVREGDRVAGVVVEHSSGRETLRARLVVGADGPHSTVAKLTGVEESLCVDGSRGGYFAYFPAPSRWDYPWDGTLEHRGDELRYVFRTDGGLVLLASVTTREQAVRWGRNWREKMREHLQGSPITRSLVEGREQVGKGCGLVKMQFFYRRPIGPGFALVGDAGHFKDFVTGQGMSDALLDAERLARAVVDGHEVAFERYWYERDVETLPLHFDAIRQGTVGYNNAFSRFVFRHLHARRDLLERFALVNEREITPDALIPMKTMLAWVSLEMLRGGLGVFKGFLETGRSMGEEQKYIASRRALLDRLRAAA